MTRALVTSLISCAVVVALLVGCPARGHAQSSLAGEDEDAIMKVIVQTTEAFNKHDAVAFARFYTSDADLVTVRGEWMKGGAEIERGLSRIFQARAKHATLRPVEVRVRVIRPDVAVAHVINELSGLVDPEGRTLPPHRELSIRVFVKDGGVWRVRAFHNTITPTPSNKELQRTRPAQATEPRR
jgi:uncharacterized protein (TIGR02246 family)